MSTKPEQFSELHRRNMEAAMRLAQLSLEHSQRIMALQNELARELLMDSVSNAQSQVEAADPQDSFRMRAAYAQETAQKMMATARRIAEVGNDTRSQFSRLLTEQLAAGSQEMVEAFQGFLSALPGQNANVMESMQQAMATANGAFERIVQASTGAFQQMNDMARGAAPTKK